MESSEAVLLFKDSFVEYDERLISQFYSELMVPSFPQPEELEPLENFTVKRNQCASVELHVLIYYKVIPPLSNTSDEPPQPPQYQIHGGVIFEFFISVNCGLITYMLVNKETRGKGLARKLLNQAVEELDNIARTQCSLAGCNAIFLETNSSIKVSKDKDIMDPRVRHAIYHHMGLRLVNFAYVQPPLSSGQEKCNTLLLCVYLSPKIPSFQQGGETVNYIPASTVRNFYNVLWKTSVERGRLTKQELQSDVDLKRAMMQLARQDKIRLLDLPWDRPWYLVELSENFDESLLQRFYNELVASTTNPEALEDVNVWINNLTDESASKPVVYHVLLALRDPDEEEYSIQPASKKTRLEDLTILVGGVTFEYYPQSNCGLISYFVVRKSGQHPLQHPQQQQQQQHLASQSVQSNIVGSLLERVVEIFHQTASKYGHLARCNAIYLECSMTDKTAAADVASSSSSLLNVATSHKLLQSLGFAMLDLVYAQPPVSTAAKITDAQLSLTVFAKDGNLPRVLLPYGVGSEGEKLFFLPTSLVSAFIKDYWKNVCKQNGEPEYHKNIKFLRMRDQFRRRENIPLFSSLPWESAWSFLDMRTDYSADMLQEFHKVLVKRKYPTFDVQPLQYYANIFSPHDNGQDDMTYLSTEGIHCILAISYSESHPGPVVAGGAVFEYFQQNNCALITHLVVLPSKRNRSALVGRLLHEISRFLDLEATGRGHLAGCNAVFMLVHPKSSVGDSSTSEDMDLAAHHQTLCDAGLRMLDLDFLLPPFLYRRMLRSFSVDSVSEPSPAMLSQVTPMLLTTLVMPRIPQNGIDGNHFLPNSFISKFVSKLWRDILNRNNQDPALMDGVAYQRMLAQIRIRHKVPLVHVPWDSPFLLLDIAEDFNEDLLRSFYRELVYNLRPKAVSGASSSTVLLQSPDPADEEERSFNEWVDLLWLPGDDDEHADAIETSRSDYFALEAGNTSTNVYPSMRSPPVTMTPLPMVMGYNASPSPPLAVQSTPSIHVPTVAQAVASVRGSTGSMYSSPVPPLAFSSFQTLPPLHLGSNFQTPPLLASPFQFGQPSSTPSSIRSSTAIANSEFQHGGSGIKSPQPAPVIPAVKCSHIVLGLVAAEVNSNDESEDAMASSAGEASEPVTDNPILSSSDSQAAAAAAAAAAAVAAATTSNLEPAPVTKETLPAQKRTLESSANRIAGGIVFDYFPKINVGLISHLVIADPSHMRLCRELLNHALEILETSAHEAGFLGGCDAIFAEAKAFNLTSADLPVTLNGPKSTMSAAAVAASPTTSSSDAVRLTPTAADQGQRSPVQDVLASHSTLFQLGWRLMDLVYEPPPGSLTALLTSRGRAFAAAAAAAATPSTGSPLKQTANGGVSASPSSSTRPDVLLLIMESDNIPGIVHADRALRYLPKSTVANFLQSHWRTSSTRESDALNSMAFKRMIDQVHRRQETPLIMELPWDAPVIVLDLKVDYNEELIEQYYRRFGPSATDPRNDADPFEPLDEWISVLQDDSKHSHLLLALKYPRQTSMPVVVGGMLVTYLPQINCGLYSRLNMTPRGHQQGIASLLLEEGEALLDIEASEAGHIAGCHVILIETFLQPPSSANRTASTVDEEDTGSRAKSPTLDSKPPRRENERCSQLLLHSHPLIQFLDFDYLPGAKLGVYRTDRIPKRSATAGNGLGVNEVYYLPSPLISRVIKLRHESPDRHILGLSTAATQSALESVLNYLSQVDSVTLKPLVEFL